MTELAETGLSPRVLTALAAGGVATLAHLTARTRSQVDAIANIGEAALAEIEAMMAARRLVFAGVAPPPPVPAWDRFAALCRDSAAALDAGNLAAHRARARDARAHYDQNFDAIDPTLRAIGLTLSALPA